MKKNMKIKAIAIAMLAVGSMAAMLMLSACTSKATPTPIESEPISSEVSSEVSSEPPMSSEVSSAPTSSEVVSEPTSSAESVVSSKPTPSKVESKPPVSSKPVSSQPPKVESKPVEKPKTPVVDEFPTTDVKNGDAVIKDGVRYRYLNGDWLSAGSGEVVDDSDKTYPPCETCGQPQGQCVCYVGY